MKAETVVQKFYVSSPKMTVLVEVRNGMIVAGAPVIGCFFRPRQQPFANLIKWMKPDVVEEIAHA